jgi:hypothetical protein
MRIEIDVPMAAWRAVGFPDTEFGLNDIGVVMREANETPRLTLVVDRLHAELDVANLRVGDSSASNERVDSSLGLVAVDHLMVRTRDAQSTLDDLATAFNASIDTDPNGERTVSVGGVRIDMVPTADLPVAAEVWGVAFRVADIDVVAERLGADVLGAAKPARQAGQRVAVFRGAAALGVPTALIDLRG